MIQSANLCLEYGDVYLDRLSLEVAEGEIYFLLNRQDQDNDFLFRTLSGFQPCRQRARSHYDGMPLNGAQRPERRLHRPHQR